MRESELQVGPFSFRPSSSADVVLMEQCRSVDADAGPADPRMAAYLDGRHHPQQALALRTAFIALKNEVVVGYIAGHATTRLGCDGEVQYLYVTPRCRRHRVAATLLRLLAEWFSEHGIRRVCVNVDVDSHGAVPFYNACGAASLNKYWYVWEDIAVLA